MVCQFTFLLKGTNLSQIYQFIKSKYLNRIIFIKHVCVSGKFCLEKMHLKFTMLVIIIGADSNPQKPSCMYIMRKYDAMKLQKISFSKSQLSWSCFLTNYLKKFNHLKLILMLYEVYLNGLNDNKNRLFLAEISLIKEISTKNNIMTRYDP